MGQKDQWHLLKWLSKRKKRSKLAFCVILVCEIFHLVPRSGSRDIFHKMWWAHFIVTNSENVLHLNNLTCEEFAERFFIAPFKVPFSNLMQWQMRCFSSSVFRLCDLTGSIRHSLWELLSSICVLGLAEMHSTQTQIKWKSWKQTNISCFTWEHRWTLPQHMKNLWLVNPFHWTFKTALNNVVHCFIKTRPELLL